MERKMKRARTFHAHRTLKLHLEEWMVCIVD